MPLRSVHYECHGFVVGSQRPLRAAYRPDERFEISAAGLQEWYRSDCFRRVAAFYAGYPEHSIFADNGRALMHHLIVMLRPERLLEIGTMYAGTTEVLARAVWEAGRGHVETLDPYGAERCPALITEFLPDLRERRDLPPAVVGHPPRSGHCRRRLLRFRADRRRPSGWSLLPSISNVRPG